MTKYVGVLSAEDENGNVVEVEHNMTDEEIQEIDVKHLNAVNVTIENNFNDIDCNSIIHAMFQLKSMYRKRNLTEPNVLYLDEEIYFMVKKENIALQVLNAKDIGGFKIKSGIPINNTSPDGRIIAVGYLEGRTDYFSTITVNNKKENN